MKIEQCFYRLVSPKDKPSALALPIYSHKIGHLILNETKGCCEEKLFFKIACPKHPRKIVQLD